MTSLSTGNEQTIILLGASNISLGWRPLIQSVLARRSRPIHLLTAHGMGRSYIAPSRFGWRLAPGILETQLWHHLRDGHTQPPSAALITDLGNDLVYGRSVDDILQAAEEVICRIRQSNPVCPIVVTRPPLASVESLSMVRYRLFRTAIFPFCKLSLHEAIAGTQELDRRIRALNHVEIASTQQKWFGLDPIHIRRSFRREAFESFLAPWPDESDTAPIHGVAPPGRPQMSERWVFGWQREAPQPSAATSGCLVSAW